MTVFFHLMTVISKQGGDNFLFQHVMRNERPRPALAGLSDLRSQTGPSGLSEVRRQIVGDKQGRTYI